MKQGLPRDLFVLPGQTQGTVHQSDRVIAVQGMGRNKAVIQILHGGEMDPAFLGLDRCDIREVVSSRNWSAILGMVVRHHDDLFSGNARTHRAFYIYTIGGYTYDGNVYFISSTMTSNSKLDRFFQPVRTGENCMSSEPKTTSRWALTPVPTKYSL